MSKKIVRLAVVRKDDADPCPFGLSIPFGCKHAGDIIDKLAPLKVVGEDGTSEDRGRVIKANKKLFTWRLMNSAEKPVQCKYASNVVKEKDAVVCNYEDAAPGIGPTPFLGSPFYSRVMSGIALDGLYSYPIGYYADYNISRNLFYGNMSLQGSANPELKKLSKNNIDTANGACVLFYCPDKAEVFLLRRSSKVSDPNTWGLPGGHLQKGEFPAQGAARELYEELGFVPSPQDIISSGQTEMDGKGKCVVFVTAIRREAREEWDEKIKLNWEHEDYKWFKTSDIPDNLHPVAEFILLNSANI